MSAAVRWRVFGLAAIAINLIAFAMVRAVPRPAVGVGAAFDVAVTVPALYFLLVVRGGLQPVITLVPLCLLGLVRATYLAPGMAWARPALGGAAELAVIGLIGMRLRRGWHAGAEDADALVRIERAAREIVPARRVAAILAGELAVFYYAFGCWRQRPHAPAGSAAFSIHEKSGAAALFGMLAGVSVMEAGLVHLVVARWSVTGAWVLTALSLYGMIWLTAVARAFVLRPVLVQEGVLIARGGLLWTLRVPVHAICAIETGSADYELKLPPASEPNVVLRFGEPVIASGMYGMTRRASSVGLAVDDRTGFLAELRPADADSSVPPFISSGLQA
jgi:hypothetical protein